MTTASVTLPEPKITIPYSPFKDEQGRSRKATFFIDPEPVNVGDKARAVQLFVSHDKHRKVFTASLTPITIERGEHFTSEGFMLFSGGRIATQPVARFSAKAIEAFFAEVLESLPAKVEAIPALAEMFTNHEEAAGRVL